MDPLPALRDLAIRGDLDTITRTDTEFKFGSDYSFPISLETAFRSKTGSPYTLETLIYLLQNRHLKHAEYIQSARANRIPTVTLPDRKTVLDYLLGHVASSDSIQFEFVTADTSAPLISPPLTVTVSERDETELVKLIKLMERPVKDRDSILECRNRDFYSILQASTRREEERARAESQQRKDGLVAKTRLVESQADHVHEGFPKGVPIILVPSAFQTLITIYNVKEFLEDGVFVPSEVKVRGGMAKPECVTVQKKLSRDRAMGAYEVRDKPSGMKKEDWDRVVCVFVLGKEWQFKDWPFKDHVEIFNKILGFYMRFEDDSVESAKVVKQWNVKIISISKNKRHQDRAAALEVWDRLEAFMRSRSRA